MSVSNTLEWLRIARLTGVNTPMEVTDSDTTAYVPTPDTDYAPGYTQGQEVTRQNDHGSIELSAPTQDGDTP